MGGKFTTIEGLLEALRTQLKDMNQFQLGDSSLNIDREKHIRFLQKLEELETGKIPFTLIVDDPVSNSYVQNIYAPDPDPNLRIEKYTRSWEQDEELGLHQMNVDNYSIQESS
jgi:zinc finger protein